MANQMLFNLRYAYQNIRRGGLWTVFAVFCIAAGVSAVVALRGLGLSIEDTLTSTVRESNKGDITLIRGSDTPISAITGIEGVGRDTERSRALSVFNEQQLTRIREHVEENDGRMSAYIMGSGIQVAPLDATTEGRPLFLSVFLIDPATYSPLGPVATVDPPDATVNDLLATDDNVIVISQNFADSQNIRVGEQVRISGTDEPFTVVGIAATEEQAGLTDLIASFFGFAYLNQDKAEMIGSRTQPNRIAIAFPPGTDIKAQSEALGPILPSRTNIRDVPEMQEGLGMFADVLGRLIVITGLGALIIGGVGIINTMLVMVRRRTMEIATLKTFGLKGGQIAALFTWEAVLLGLLGSASGVLLGTLLGGVVNRFGEAFLQQSLVWRFYPEAALYGIALGMSVTVVFGVTPVLTATKVRPAIVLRPNETHVPVVGWLQTLGVMLITVVAIGMMVGSILIGLVPPGTPFFGLPVGDVVVPFLIGIVGTAVAFIVIGVLVVVMWAMVWVISRLPAFGLVDLRLALRNLTTRRWRTATTLLALAAGMYALSSITFISQTTRDTINVQLTNTLGGNVLLFPLSTVFSSASLAEPVINARVDTLEGVQGITRSDFYPVQGEQLNGGPIEAETFTFTNEDGEEESFTDASFLIQARRSNNPNLTSGTLVAGRDLTPDDAGQRVMVIKADTIADGAVQLNVGDTITVDSQGTQEDYTFEIVGITSGNTPTFSDAFVPLDAIPNRAVGSLFTIQVAEEHLDQALVELTALPTVFVIDISFIDGLIQRLIDQFSALPTVVGLMALLAAAAIMANTVLLATLERRKQIGVLKAIGLKGWRVMGVLLIENSLIALLGCAIGIGLSAVNSSLLSWAGLGQVEAIPPNALPLVGVLVGAALLISWLATFASAGSLIRENVSTVLRYE